MTTQRLLFILPLLIWLAGCSDINENPDSEQVPADTVGVAPLQFYKRFEGTVAGQNVVVHLHRKIAMDEAIPDTTYSLGGVYYYEKIGRPISLYGTNDTADERHYILDEYSGTRYATGNARWDIFLKDDGITGTWVSADSAVQYDIRLNEQYPAGSYHVALWHNRKDIPFKPGKAQPAATWTATILVPGEEMNSADSAFLRHIINQSMGDTGSLSTEQIVSQQADSYTAYYRRTIAEEYVADSSENTFRFNYYTNTDMRVRYNDKSMLVVEVLSSDYTGGAHGMYASSYLNIDMRESRLWHLDEVLRVDTPALRILLEKEARRMFDIPANEKLGSRLLTEIVNPTANFYIAPAGLVFVYTPYEIASYADGQPELFIPYTVLKKLLTPEFKQRMNL